MEFKDLIDKHKDEACVVAASGPSLNTVKGNIEKGQRKGKLLRISTNNWYDFFDEKPDYWVLANTQTETVQNLAHKMNEHMVPILFADSVDLTEESFIEENLKCDYLGYDQRHFKNSTCMEIIKSFKEHYENKQDFNFLEYGNNSKMWAPPRCNDGAGFSGVLSYGVGFNGRCCRRIKKNRLTIQEELQQVSGFNQHYSTGDTVALHLIAFAIIMGCNPIYVAGLDLDYAKGYADSKVNVPINMGAYNDWSRLRENLLNDLYILNKSAKLRDIKVINLNKDAWYNQFDKGDLRW